LIFGRFREVDEEGRGLARAGRDEGLVRGRDGGLVRGREGSSSLIDLCLRVGFCILITLSHHHTISLNLPHFTRLPDFDTIRRGGLCGRLFYYV
jgi:hypothetical protein